MIFKWIRADPTILLATILILVWLAYSLTLAAKQRGERLPQSLPDSKALEEAANQLWSLYQALPDEEPDTALFLLEESRKAYEGWIESNARLEGKATWLTGFLAGGTGLLTLIATLHGGSPRLQIGPYLFVAGFGAIAALLSCLYILRPKLRPHPTIVDYINPTVALSPKSRFHIALTLADDYNRFGLEVGRLRRYDPIAWSVAQAALVLTVIAIIFEFYLVVSVAPSQPPKNMVRYSHANLMHEGRTHHRNQESTCLRNLLPLLSGRSHHRRAKSCTKAGARRLVLLLKHQRQKNKHKRLLS